MSTRDGRMAEAKVWLVVGKFLAGMISLLFLIGFVGCVVVQPPDNPDDGGQDWTPTGTGWKVGLRVCTPAESVCWAQRHWDGSYARSWRLAWQGEDFSLTAFPGDYFEFYTLSRVGDPYTPSRYCSESDHDRYDTFAFELEEGIECYTLGNPNHSVPDPAPGENWHLCGVCGEGGVTIN